MNFKNREDVKVWIRSLVHDAFVKRDAKIASTTPEQAIAMLYEIVVRSDPNTWTQQDCDNIDTITFVADWIRAQRKGVAQ